eukprot:15357735-Ditylum_brightwellii.AAC.1
MGIVKLTSKSGYFYYSGYWLYHPVMKELGIAHDCFTFLWRHLHLSTVDMYAVEAEEAMDEQEMRNSGINNEEVLLLEPIVVHYDEGADNDNDDLSTSSEDTALAAGVQPEDMMEAESQPEPESQ